MIQKKIVRFINNEVLNKKTIEDIMTEIFSDDVEQNEKEIQNFKVEYDL